MTTTDAPGLAVADATFLAPTTDIPDWRMVVLVDAAVRGGVLDALPGTVAEVAATTSSDPRAVRTLLQALEVWAVVTEDGGVYRRGAGAPDEDLAAVLYHHARAIRQWSGGVHERLRGPLDARGGDQRTPAEVGAWLRSMGVGARRTAPGLVDLCLERFPSATRVLDVAGGHGEYGLAFARRGLDVTYQDLPNVVDIVGQWPGLRDSGVTLVPGSVFETLPDGPFDLVWVSGFTHTVPGDAVATLFARLGQVTAPGGGIAVNTMLRASNESARLFAVQMLLGARGGDTHLLAEYETWLEAAGYEDVLHVDVGGRTLLLAARAN